MAFIPVPNTVEIVFVFTVQGREVRVVLNATNAVAWTIGTMETLAAAIIEAIYTDGLGWLSTQYAIAFLHLVDLTTATGPSFDQVMGVTHTLPKSGTRTGGALGGQCALVTTLRTANRGRSYRGRNYWPGISESDINNDAQTIGVGRVPTQQAFVAAVQTAIESFSGVKMVVVSRRTGGAPRVTGITSPVTSLDTNTLIDTQRRRVSP